MSRLAYESFGKLDVALRATQMVVKGETIVLDGLYLCEKVDGLNDIVILCDKQGIRAKAAYNGTDRQKNFFLKSRVASYGSKQVEVKEMISLINSLSKKDLQLLSVNLPKTISRKRQEFYLSLFLKKKKK